jgi:predicted RNA-binding protein Jag
MKSMLHEASSVISAIEKAWAESGKPSEFTVKILEEGQKGFLGFTKRPAIVSITFNSVKAPEKSKYREREYQQRPNRAPQPYQQNQQPRQMERSDRNQYQDGGRPQRVDSQEFAKRQQAAVAKNEQVKLERKAVPSQMAAPVEEPQVWTPEWSSFISENLTEMLKSLQFQLNFTIKTDKKALTIVFDKPVMGSEDENRAFAAGSSYLLMQFLKRKYKKKFRGYQIFVTSLSPHDFSKPNKPN